MKKIDCVRLRSWLIAGVVLLCSTAAHASLGDVLEGQDKGDTNTWKAGNLQDWQELDFIPCRIYISTGPVVGKVYTISFPHITGSVPGFENLYNFVASSNVVFLSGPTLSSPANADWSYSFTVDVTDSSPTSIQFLARLAAGAHLSPGSSLKLTGSPASLGNLQIHKPAAGPGAPDLAINKTGPASAQPGDIITYTLAYTNQSDVSTAAGAQISDIIPAEITVLTNTLDNNAHFVGDTIFWDLTNVAAHSAGQVSYQAQINLAVPVGRVLTNFSQILSSEDDANYADNTSIWSTTVISGCVNPPLTCVGDKTVECGTAWSFDSPMASDAAASNSVVVLDTITNAACGNTFFATRTWQATDACGNTNSCSQTVEVVDTIAPVITCSSNVTVECAGPAGTPVEFIVTASDACDTNVLIYSVPPSGTAFTLGTNTVYSYAVDSCGNTNTCAFTVTVVDTTPPAIVCATNRTVECSAAWEFDTPLVFDACDPTNVVLMIAGTTTNNHCGQTFTAVRTWLATDAFGNTNSCNQTIEVVDTTPPILVSATNRTVECSTAWEFDTPLVSDACDPTNVVFAIVGTMTNNHCGVTFTATRTWLATDACGNTNSCSQTVEVVDTTPPTIICSSNIVVECAGPAGTPVEFAVTASDACDTNVLIYSVPPSGTAFMLGTNTVHSFAVDSCGNTNTCAFTVTVVDTTPPTIVCATNRTVECSTAWEFDTPLVSDTCDPISVVLTIAGTMTNNHCGSTFTATRNWLATDASGNTNSCSQTVEVVDTTPPTIVCGTNRTVECSAAWEFDTPFVSDACDPTNVVLTIVGTITNNHCGVTFTATRTWLATDACGNTNSCSQTVEVVDTIAPVIYCASNIVVECAGPAGTPVEFAVTASDACDTNVLVYSVPPSGTAFTLGTNTVHSFAVDSCGNTNTCAFTVTVVDTTPPTILCPADIIAAESPRDSGSAPVTYPAPAVGDICDDSLTPVTYPPSGFAFPVGTNTVNAFVTDDSGNSNSCSFTVRVIPYRLYVTNTADAGPGTLRQALLDANDAPGENLVLFNLPGAGIHTIALAAPLPEITSPIILNGWSQPGFLSKPLVEVTGSYLPTPTNGIVISAGASTVRGLILNGFGTALRLTGNGTNVIQGNFIGTDATGTNAVGNTGDGLYIACDRNLIGGTTNLSGNVLAGNGDSGVHFDGAAANLNVVQGNLIGVGADGVTPAGNKLDGVRLENGATRNSLGATGAPGLNVIAFNGRNGVTLEATAGSRNSILANLIHHNVGLGIDLGNDGPTPNDFNDTDTGPNQLQNFPVLTDARADGGLIIEGTLNSTPNASYRLDFWLNNTPDPSTNGEGQFYLGSSTVVLDSSGTQDFAVNFAVSAVYTQFVTATAMDQSGNSSEFSRAVQVRTPPVLGAAPVGTNSPAGGTVTFCASASGTPPIYYQWRLNGQNIPGATNACYTLSSVQATNSGTYSVVVYNVLGSLLTPPAPLVLTVSNAVAAADNFADRVRVFGMSGQTAGANRNATRETGEPNHAGKPGGKSVWYTWKAPETGIATIGTSGSDFDTLLGIYTGSKVTNLVVVASDEDGGGFFTSGVRFNVFEDQFYHFAIDGYAGDSGDFIFGWQFEETERLLPVITTQPQSQTVAPGSNVTFTVAAVRQCKEGHAPCDNEDHYPHNHLPALTVQWFFEGSPMPGKTNYSLTITNVDVINVGQYFASVTIAYETDDDDHDRHDDAPFRTVESAVADLQINVSGFTSESVKARDKLADALLETPWFIGFSSAIVSSELTASPQPPPDSSVTVVSGFTGTQVFNTAGSTTSPAEDPICGVLGGASEWLTFVTADSGYLFLNTDGSSYDTVMAVFRRSPTNASVLQYVMCDNDSGANGRSSAMAVPVVAGQTNVLVVDGVNGAAGTLQLNYSLGSKISLSALAPVQGAAHLQVSGWVTMKFSLQTSTNLTQWSTILTTNSPTAIYDFIDTTSPKTSPRFYRAKLLP